MSAASVEWFSVGIVLHHTSIDVLKRSLSSLLEALESLVQSQVDKSEDLRVGVYFLDNSLDQVYSSRVEDVLTELSPKEGAGVDVYHHVLDDNLGYGAANNTLLSTLSSRFHLVLNPDVYLERDALVCAVDYLQSRSDVVMLTPKIDGDHVVKSYPDCLTLILRYFESKSLSRFFRRRLDRYRCADLRLEADVSGKMLGGCFMLMSTAHWRKAGGFDPRFFMYFEDFDLSLRMARLGRLAYVPQVRVGHDGGGVGRKAFAHHRFFTVSLVRFFTKNGWKLL